MHEAEIQKWLWAELKELHSNMAVFIKLVNGYNSFSMGTKVSRPTKIKQIM